MYRGPPRGRPYPAYGAYRGPPRGGYSQPMGVPQPRHPYLDLLGIQNKFYFSELNRPLDDLLQRHPRRQVGADLVSMKCHYGPKSKAELAIPLNVHIPFNLKGTGTVVAPEPAATQPHEKDGVKTRYFAKVIILSGPAPEDEKVKGKVHLSKRLNFLLARKEHGTILPIGGEWSAEKDGATPNDASLKKTAIRIAKDLVGVDLSPCTKWTKFVEFLYNRTEGHSCTVFFVPNVWDHFPNGIEPSNQVREESKEVEEEVEEEEEDPDDSSKKKTIKKKVTKTKTVQVVEYRPHEMTLHNLLEYDCNRPTADDIVELCLFADCFNEMLQRDFGLQILEILEKKKEESEEQQEAEKKRKREEEEAAAAKKMKTDEELKKEEEKKDETEAVKKPKMKIQHNVNQEILLPFQYFDKQPHTGTITGNLKRDVLEGMLHQLNDFTKHEVDELLLKGANLKPKTGAYNSPPSILYYIKIATTTTEVPIEEDEKKEEEDKKEEKKEEEKKEEKKEEPKEEKAEADESMVEDEEGKEAEAEDGAMTEASLNKLLLKDLRAMCTEKGLNANGKKAELIERLLKGA